MVRELGLECCIYRALVFMLHTRACGHVAIRVRVYTWTSSISCLHK